MKHKTINEEVDLAIKILDAFFVAEGGKNAQARVFDNAIRGLRHIQEWGVSPEFVEVYYKRRKEQAADVRRVRVYEPTTTESNPAFARPL